MTMITVIQIGALTFMTLLPVALSVILYMAERQPWTKKFSYGVKQAIIGVLFGLVAVLATEAGILHELQRTCPNQEFIPVPPEVSEGSLGCSCNECEYMKKNTLQKIYNALKEGWPAIEIDADVARDAVKPIKRMLELS